MLNKKNILGIAAIVSTVVLAANAYATVPGVYLGGTLGWGDVHQYDNDGIAGRLFGGYQLNDFVAAELGYSKFSNVTSNSSISGTLGDGSAFKETLKSTLKTSAVDLVAKGIVPLQNGFSLYGKLGAAYLMQDAHSKASGAVAVSDSSDANKIYPTFGLGASYDITPNAAVDVSWNRIQKVGSHADINSTDLVGAGFTYSFG